MKAKIYPIKAIQPFCDTHGCHKKASYFMGNPSGPVQKNYKLCESCKESLIESLIRTEGEGIVTKAEDIVKKDKIARDKEQYGGKEFVCKECGEVLYSPQTLGAHMKYAHPKRGGEGESKQ